MTSITFLGTGPTKGIEGKGRNRRRESSLLLRTGAQDFLFDVSRDFDWQKRFIKSLEAILITHAHSDAIGGIPRLKKWLKKKELKNPVPLWSHSITLRHIKKRFKGLEKYLDFRAIKPGQKIKAEGLVIIPVLVPHSIQPGFPTFAFDIKIGREKIIYASDIAEIKSDFKKRLDKIDILIIDGAMWNKKIKSHLEIHQLLSEICRLKIKKIYLTHIGRTAPRYETLKKEVKKLCSKAEPAYDGLKIFV